MGRDAAARNADVDLAGSDRHAYLPIRLVEIDRNRRIVRADSGDMEEHGAESTRLTDADLSKVRRDVRYADVSGERVVERRPILEETVVRRRDAEPESRA